MTRKAHFLTTTHSRTIPVNWVFFDCETQVAGRKAGSTFNVLKLGVAQRYRWYKDKGLRFQREKIFYTGAELAAFIYSVQCKRAPLYLVAHNLGFDTLASDMLSAFKGFGFTLRTFYAQQGVSIFHYTSDKGKIVALDSGNFFKGSVRELGDLLNNPKLDIDFEHSSERDLIDYCRQDVEIVAGAMDQFLHFLRDNDLGEFRTTLSSCAFYAFRHRFLKHDVFIHNDKEALALEESAYHGGRIEILKAGYYAGSTLRYLDVNSMYPYVSRDRLLPNRLTKICQDASYAQLENALYAHAVIADVEVATDEPVFPLLYQRRRYYPTGSFRTTLSTPELLYAVEHNLLMRCHSMAVYAQEAVFRDFMESLYALRLQFRASGNGVYDQLCKLFMNGATGKWAQHETVVERLGDHPGDYTRLEHEYHYNTGEHSLLYYLPTGVYKERRAGFAFNAFPAIAAHITAYGRMYLWKLMQMADRDNLYYVDSDGFWANSLAYERLASQLDPLALGRLKVAYESPWLEILGPRQYDHQGGGKHSGIKAIAVQFAPGVYAQEQFASFKGSVRNGTTAGVTITTIEKTLHATPSTYWIDPDGLVVPLRFELQPEGTNYLPAMTRGAGSRATYESLQATRGARQALRSERQISLL
jgi:hypothetical protein